MAFKINIGHEGKSWKIETEDEFLIGKSVGDKFDGKELKAELEGYELEITGGTDFAGFPMKEDVEGIGLKRVLLTKGEWGLHKRPKGDKKKVPQSKGLRLRKTVRGKTISDQVIQINIKVLKAGSKKLEEVFPDQNKKEEPPKEETSAEAPKEEAKAAEPAQEAPKAESEEKKEE